MSYSKIINIFFGDSKSLRVLTNPVSNGKLAIQVNQASEMMLFNAEGKLIRRQRVLPACNL